MTDVNTDAPTMPMSTSGRTTPRERGGDGGVSATLIVAATLAFVGAAITVGSLFPDYWDAPSFALLDDTATLAHTAVFAGALLLAGILLLPRASAPVGAALLVVAVAFGLQPRVSDVVTLAETDGPRAGTGFALLTAGFVLGIFAAVLSSFVVLRPRQWSLRGGARFLTGLAALTGFATAVGYVMSPFSIRFEGLAFVVTGGSPLDASEPRASRELWAAVLIVVLLAVIPPIAIAVGGRIGSGLALGLLFGIGGIAALRLGAIYGSVEIVGRRSSAGLEAAEGTWTFLAAGGATLLLVLLGLATGGVRRSRASTLPPVLSPTEPPTDPVVVGGDPGAIVDPSDAEAAGVEAGDDAETTMDEPTRVPPMRPAEPPATTWTAPGPEGSGSQGDRQPE